MADDTWEGRVRETLDYLRQKAQHTFRSSAEGQTIEGAACRLSSRSSWWPNDKGKSPVIDEAITVPDWVLRRKWCQEQDCDNDMTLFACPNNPTVCVDHCNENHEPVSD